MPDNFRDNSDDAIHGIKRGPDRKQRRMRTDKRAGPGRPAAGSEARTETLPAAVTPSLKDWYNAKAQADNMSRSALATTALEEYRDKQIVRIGDDWYDGEEVIASEIDEVVWLEISLRFSDLSGVRVIRREHKYITWSIKDAVTVFVVHISNAPDLNPNGLRGSFTQTTSRPVSLPCVRATDSGYDFIGKDDINPHVLLWVMARPAVATTD